MTHSSSRLPRKIATLPVRSWNHVWFTVRLPNWVALALAPALALRTDDTNADLDNNLSPNVRAWTNNADMIVNLSEYYRYLEYLVAADSSEFAPPLGPTTPGAFLTVSETPSSSKFPSNYLKVYSRRWTTNGITPGVKLSCPHLRIGAGCLCPARHRRILRPNHLCPMWVGPIQMSPMHRMFGALTNSGTTTDPVATVPVPNGGNGGLQLGAAFEGADTTGAYSFNTTVSTLNEGTECGTKRPASGGVESDVRSKAKPIPAVVPGPS
ncbi:hypothetical protein DFH09DRAFT_1079490 [Mycena vulgaris]|nr:hypothetical protein DFH09DRAFT_1079490 [Mycena vulgaris]